MSANATDTNAGHAAPTSPAVQPTQSAPTPPQESQTSVPKQIVNAQTVCNQRNAKNKLCNGHLKQLHTGGEEAEKHLRGNDVLFKCQVCGTLYMGPPLGHVRDPDKQERFVERELAALLQAAGGSLPAFKKSQTGAWIPVEEGVHHAPAPAKPAPAAAKPAPATAKPTAATETPEEKKARLVAEAKTRTDAAGDAQPSPTAPAQATTAKPAAQTKHTAPRTSLGPIPGASGPVPGETHEQKIARLKAVVAEAKRRKELMAGDEAAHVESTAGTTPTAASTSGTDSSAEADAHRPAAEAQAATGQASAVPLSSSAASASPAAGAETAADLAPDASTDAATAAQASGAQHTATVGERLPAFDPVPGETHEQKIERLKKLVNAAMIRAGKPPKY